MKLGRLVASEMVIGPQDSRNIDISPKQYVLFQWLIVIFIVVALNDFISRLFCHMHIL